MTDTLTSWLQRIVVLLLVALVVAGAITFLRSGTSEAKPAADAGSPAASYVDRQALPAGARSEITRIEAGGPFPNSDDGAVYPNAAHRLPIQPAGYYHRYAVSGSAVIVAGSDGTLYYSSDARTFRQIRR